MPDQGHSPATHRFHQRRFASPQWRRLRSFLPCLAFSLWTILPTAWSRLEVFGSEGRFRSWADPSKGLQPGVSPGCRGPVSGLPPDCPGRLNLPAIAGFPVVFAGFPQPGDPVRVRFSRPGRGEFIGHLVNQEDQVRLAHPVKAPVHQPIPRPGVHQFGFPDLAAIRFAIAQRFPSVMFCATRVIAWAGWTTPWSW